MFPLLSLRAQICHMDIGSGPRVISQIPAGMIGVLVDHDRIAVPKPIVHIREIERGNSKIITGEPKSLAVAAFEVEDMLGPKASAKMAVLKRMVLMKPPVVAGE